MTTEILCFGDVQCEGCTLPPLPPERRAAAAAALRRIGGLVETGILLGYPMNDVLADAGKVVDGAGLRADGVNAGDLMGTALRLRNGGCEPQQP